MANDKSLRNNIPEWLDEHKNQFQPPVCLKTMYNSQLTMIFLRGPNSRQDFHIEEGEEIFFMMEGEMNLKVIDRNEFRDISIKAGEIFVLPARVQHSPRRPINSLGYVIERKRLEGKEYDGLIYYDEENPVPVLNPMHQVYGYIGDNFEEEIKNLVKSANHDISIGNVTSRSTSHVDQLVTPDYNAKIPDPISIKVFIQDNETQIKQNGRINMFPDQKQTRIEMLGDGEHACHANDNDMIIWVIKGNVLLKEKNNSPETVLQLNIEDLYLLKTGTEGTLIVDVDSLVLTIQMARV